LTDNHHQPEAQHQRASALGNSLRMNPYSIVKDRR